MLIKKFYQSKLIHSVLVLISRWVVIMPNFSLVGTYGFSGQNFLGFYGGILVFDWLKSGFYPGFIFTYLGFFGYYLFGRLSFKFNSGIKYKRSKIKLQLTLLLLASLWFFLISNFGVWIYWYPNTLQGLLSCYVAALPFYRNTLLGDLFFGSSFMLLREFHLNSRYLKHEFKSIISTDHNLST